MSGNEVIVTDSFTVKCNDLKFSHLDYYLKLGYYYLPADIDGSHIGEVLREKKVKLSSGNNTISFEDYPVYLQGDCELIIHNEIDHTIPSVRVELSVAKNIASTSDNVALTALVTDNAVPQENVTVTFYNGDTSVGTATTNANGVATKTVSNLTVSSHKFKAVYDNTVSNSKTVFVYDDAYVMEFTVTGNSFTTNPNKRQPFIYSNDYICIDWGDNTSGVYAGTGVISHTFEDNANSHTIKFYGTITELTNVCLKGNTGLTNVVLPNSLTTLKPGCFESCTNLSNIILPNSLTTIEHYAFEKTNLSTINIPNSVTSMGIWIFNHSPLTNITLNWSSADDIITYDYTWIISTPSSLKFHIPSGTTSLYTVKGYPSSILVEDS